MEDLKMDVSSFNSEEVVQLLLNALKISNDKCQVLSNTVTNLHNQRQEIDLAKTKITIEKNHIIDSLKTKINLLNTELVENKKSLEDLKSKSAIERQQLVDNQTSAIEELERNQKDVLSAKDTIISQRENDIEEKQNTINQLNEKLINTQKEFELFKITTLKNRISQYLGELQIDGGLLNADDLCGLKQYIDTMGISNSIFSQDYDTAESFCRVLLSPDGLISSVCNLIWWLNNESIKNTYTESIEIFKHIVCISNAALDFFKNFGYDITLPPSKFCSELEDYSLYDNDNPHIKNIFPKVSFEKYVLCEIYTVSYNNVKGKCYSL